MSEPLRWTIAPRDVAAIQRRQIAGMNRAAAVTGMVASIILGVVVWRTGLREWPPHSWAAVATAVGRFAGCIVLLIAGLSLAPRPESNRKRVTSPGRGDREQLTFEATDVSLTLDGRSHPWSEVGRVVLNERPIGSRLMALVGRSVWHCRWVSVEVPADVDHDALCATVSTRTGRPVRRHVVTPPPTVDQWLCIAGLVLVPAGFIGWLLWSNSGSLPRDFPWWWATSASPACVYAIVVEPRKAEAIFMRLCVVGVMTMTAVEFAVVAAIWATLPAGGSPASFAGTQRRC